MNLNDPTTWPIEPAGMLQIAVVTLLAYFVSGHAKPAIGFVVSLFSRLRWPAATGKAPSVASLYEALELLERVCGDRNEEYRAGCETVRNNFLNMPEAEG